KFDKLLSFVNKVKYPKIYNLGVLGSAEAMINSDSKSFVLIGIGRLKMAIEFMDTRKAEVIPVQEKMYLTLARAYAYLGDDKRFEARTMYNKKFPNGMFTTEINDLPDKKSY
ncbi:MAG: hypothetical protein HRT89_07700, partial [Lentisphaeria bacterium]|nr:hypothetical protein [Lentisphaeria bacterium]